jgi:cation transport ATPase
MKYLLPFLFALSLNAGLIIDPDVEIRINGIVCASCAIGVKNVFKKDSRVKALKMDTKKQIVLLEYWNVEIHPSKIKTMVKKTGYEVTSIKWLKDKKPNRYNKP